MTKSLKHSRSYRPKHAKLLMSSKTPSADLTSNNADGVSYPLSVIKSRIVLTAISKISKKEELTPNAISCVDTHDLIDFGSRPEDGYAQLREVADTILHKELCWKTEEGHQRVRLVSSIDYEEGNSRIGLKFSPDIMPFLFQSHALIAKHSFPNDCGLKHEYAIRIFRLCLPYCNSGWLKMTIDELRDILCLQDNYVSISLFKLRVLNMAVKQINASEYTRLTISYELIRIGCAYIEIRFTIQEKKPLSYMLRDLQCRKGDS